MELLGVNCNDEQQGVAEPAKPTPPGIDNSTAAVTGSGAVRNDVGSLGDQLASSAAPPNEADTRSETFSGDLSENLPEKSSVARNSRPAVAAPTTDTSQGLRVSAEQEIEEASTVSNVPTVTCLLCGEEIASRYLSEVFTDRKAYLIACMVMHYRHQHVRYYNNSVGWVVRNRSYEDFKCLANERAKRQIIRKCKEALRALGITSETFAQLQGTTDQTMALARKHLDSEPEKVYG